MNDYFLIQLCVWLSCPRGNCLETPWRQPWGGGAPVKLLLQLVNPAIDTRKILKKGGKKFETFGWICQLFSLFFRKPPRDPPGPCWVTQYNLFIIHILDKHNFLRDLRQLSLFTLFSCKILFMPSQWKKIFFCYLTWLQTIIIDKKIAKSKS